MAEYKYPWKYTPEERPPETWCKCYDCGMKYQEFNDMVLPNDVWEMVSPSLYEGGGLLCPTCIINRLVHINMWYDIFSPLKLH